MSRLQMPVGIFGLLTSESALFVGCYVAACYWQLEMDADVYLSNERGIARIAMIAVAFILGSYFADVRAKFRVKPLIGMFARVLGLLGGALICEAMISYLNPDLALPGSVLVAGTIVATGVLSIWRLLYSNTFLAPEPGQLMQNTLDTVVLGAFSMVYYVAVVTLKSIRHQKAAA